MPHVAPVVAAVFKPPHFDPQLALDHDDDDDDDEPAANIMPSTVTASKNVRVKSWDESLRADDLARCDSSA